MPLAIYTLPIAYFWSYYHTLWDRLSFSLRYNLQGLLESPGASPPAAAKVNSMFVELQLLPFLRFKIFIPVWMHIFLRGPTFTVLSGFTSRWRRGEPWGWDLMRIGRERMRLLRAQSRNQWRGIHSLREKWQDIEQGCHDPWVLPASKPRLEFFN